MDYLLWLELVDRAYELILLANPPPFEASEGYLELSKELMEHAYYTSSKSQFTPSEISILRCVMALLSAMTEIHRVKQSSDLKQLKFLINSLEHLADHTKWLDESTFMLGLADRFKTCPFPWGYEYEQVFLGFELDRVLNKFGERVLSYLKTRHSNGPIHDVLKCKGIVQNLQATASDHIKRNRAAALKWRAQLTDWYEQNDVVQELFVPNNGINEEIVNLMGEQKIKRCLGSYVESCLDGVDTIVTLAKLA